MAQRASGGLGPAAAGGQASSVAPPGASSANPLQEFYEAPGVPLRSGPDRARRQARMLAEMLRGFPGSAVVVDLGCGDGSALAVAAEHNPAHRFVGIDWSGDALRQARTLGLTAVRAGVAASLPVAITVFPDDVYRAPETWARRAYRNLIYFNHAAVGPLSTRAADAISSMKLSMKNTFWEWPGARHGPATRATSR